MMEGCQTVEGAEVTVTDQALGWPLYKTTDSDGIAVVQRVNEGAFNITARSEGLTGRLSGTIEPGDVLYPTVTLQETGTISGTLHYPNGTLVENAQVRLTGGLSVEPLITEADGRFVFDGIPIETIYGSTYNYRLDVYGRRPGNSIRRVYRRHAQDKGR